MDRARFTTTLSPRNGTLSKPTGWPPKIVTVSETVTVTIFDADCFIGSWVLRSQDSFDQIGAEFAGQAQGQISYRSGEN